MIFAVDGFRLRKSPTTTTSSLIWVFFYLVAVKDVLLFNLLVCVCVIELLF